MEWVSTNLHKARVSPTVEKGIEATFPRPTAEEGTSHGGAPDPVESVSTEWAWHDTGIGVGNTAVPRGRDSSLLGDELMELVENGIWRGMSCILYLLFSQSK